MSDASLGQVDWRFTETPYKSIFEIAFTFQHLRGCIFRLDDLNLDFLYLVAARESFHIQRLRPPKITKASPLGQSGT